MGDKSVSSFAAMKDQTTTEWATASACVPRAVKDRLQSRINISKTVREFLIKLDRELSDKERD